jgi:hypothetical protein
MSDVVGRLRFILTADASDLQSTFESAATTLTKSFNVATEATTSSLAHVATQADHAGASFVSLERHLGVTTGAFARQIQTGRDVDSTLMKATKTAYRFGDAQRNAANAATVAVTRFGSLKTILYQLDLANFAAFKSVEQWNLLGVIKGPGALFTAFDRLRFILTGMVPPARQVEFVIKRLLIPTLVALGTALAQIGENAGAQKLGASLLKMASDLDHVGAAYRSVGRIIADNIFGIFAGAANMAAKAVQTLVGNATPAGAIIGGLAGGLNQTAQSLITIAKYATYAAVSIGVRLVGALIGATSALIRFAGAATMSAGRALLGMNKTVSATVGNLGSLRGEVQGTQFAIRSLLGPLAFFGVAGTGLMATAAGLSRGFKDAASIEKYTASLEVMVGGAEKAKAVLKDVAAFSGQTPFALPDLERLAVNLVSFGVAAEQVRPTMKVLGDLAQGDQEKFDRLSDVYGKALNLKVVGLDDLRSIGSMGIPIFEELAKVLKVDQSQLRDLVSSGAVGTGHLQQAFANLTAEGSKFGGGMAKMAQTSGGAFTQLMANVRLTFLGVAQAFNDTFSAGGAGSALTTWVQQLRGPIIAGAKSAFQSLLVVVNTVGTFIQNNAGNLMAIWTQLSNVGAAAFGMLRTAAGTALGFIGGLLGENTGLFAGWADKIISGLLIIEFGFKNWKQNIAISLLKVAFHAVEVGATIAWVFTDAIPHYLTAAGAAIKGFVTGGIDLFKKFGEAVWTYIRSGFKDTSGFGQAFSAIGEGIASELAKIPELTRRKMTETEKLLSDTIKFEEKDAAGKFDKFAAERMKQFDDIKKGIGAAVAPGAKDAIQPFKVGANELPQAQAKQAQAQMRTEVAALDRGSAAAYSAIVKAQNAAGQKKPEVETAKNTAKLVAIGEAAAKRPIVEIVPVGNVV